MMTNASGLYYMRARYYYPEMRRFVNQDILRGTVINGQTLNRYAYVAGDPVKYTDPFGLDRFCGGGKRAVPCPGQPHVYCDCVEDGREPEKVCAGKNDEYGCMSQDVPRGGNDDGPRPYLGGGGYLDYQMLLFGLGSELSFITQGSKTCLMRTDCGGIGPGLYFGCGSTIPGGISMDDIEGSLAGYSVGLGVDAGFCWASYGFGAGAGFNEEGITSIGSSKGSARYGAGCGFSLTIDFCKTYVLWCNKP